MEVLDCEELDKEFDRVLEESEPCEDCLSKEDLVAGIITSGDLFGTIVVVCANCHLDNEEEFEEGLNELQQVMM